MLERPETIVLLALAIMAGIAFYFFRRQNKTAAPPADKPAAPPTPTSSVRPLEERERGGVLPPAPPTVSPIKPIAPPITPAPQPVPEALDKQEQHQTAEPPRGGEDLTMTGGYPGSIDDVLEPAEMEREIDGDAKAVTSEPIQFSAYYTKEIAPMTWQPMRAYVYKQSAQASVEQDAVSALSDILDNIRVGSDTATVAISEGALITCTPDLTGFQCNPPSASIAFFEDWHKFEFKIRAKDAPLDSAVNGRLTFAVDGVIVADINVSIFVGAAVGSPSTGAGRVPAQPSAQASATARVYDRIFCSYSHKDTTIVERVEKVYKLLGMDFLRDATTLKSGQDWNAELLNMIDRADIFQLFWSTPASQSQYVRQEWEHALKQHASKPAFIRPVYWEDPLPNVPDALSHIHFAFDPTLDD
jgi:hypothetical protein